MHVSAAFQRPQKSSDVCSYVALGVDVHVIKLEGTFSIRICDEGISSVVNWQTGLIAFLGVGDQERIMGVVRLHRGVHEIGANRRHLEPNQHVKVDRAALLKLEAVEECFDVVGR